MHMRRSTPADHHVLGDLLPHHRHLLDAVFRPPEDLNRLGRRRSHASALLLDERHDVVSGDAAADSRAADLGNI
jgi:hypothetical protein